MLLEELRAISTYFYHYFSFTEIISIEKLNRKARKKEGLNA